MYEDLSQANSITLREVLQQYCKEVSSTKIGYEQEKYKINKLCKNPIASLKLARVTPLQLRKFQDACRLIYNPSTTNKYITLISVSIKFARQMLGIFLVIYLPKDFCKISIPRNLFYWFYPLHLIILFIINLLVN